MHSLQTFQPVWAVMRGAGIHDLPTLTNEAQLATVTSKVNKIASKVRYVIKDAVCTSPLLSFSFSLKIISGWLQSQSELDRIT